jgi:50S ribosomal protein L16 3-hydroxylase
MNRINYRINNFDIEDFLKNYWQQKPLLIRNAFIDFQNPLSPDELAGLSCEEEIESRLITKESNNWQLEHGPFPDSKFSTLQKNNWTLLVQAVDHYVPDVAELLNFFRFIPNWRIDDVMVSYATVGGSVGPHYDNYDVFLLQGSGHRQWELGPRYDSQTERLDNEDLRLIKNFQTKEEWILNPGDLLYIPPLYGHWGTSTSNDCMTYSIGFRAPSYAELISDYCDKTIEGLKDELRINDAGLKLQKNPGELTQDNITSIISILQNQFSDKKAISRWFGQYMTEPKYSLKKSSEQLGANEDDHCTAPQSTDSLTHWLESASQETIIYRDAAARFSYTEVDNTVLSFVNGVSYEHVSLDCIEYLCATDRFSPMALSSFVGSRENALFLHQLYMQGTLYFDDEILD